jgi:hypothetical protein
LWNGSRSLYICSSELATSFGVDVEQSQSAFEHLNGVVAFGLRGVTDARQ